MMWERKEARGTPSHSVVKPTGISVWLAAYVIRRLSVRYEGVG